jgi:hypothetical protein
MYEIVKHLQISILKTQSERLSDFTVPFLKTQFYQLFSLAVSTVPTKFDVTKNYLKVHKIEIFFGFDFEICVISLLFMSKY